MKQDLSCEIKDVLYGYVKAESISNTKQEKRAEEYFLNYFSQQEYFKKNPEHYGAFPIEGDPHGRAAVWAMVKGSGDKTVVLIHHNDVVTVEDFKSLKEYAFSPDELEEQLLLIKDSLLDEAKTDLESKKYLFGRGVCDMKGGGSIQMALLTEYSKEENFEGNIIVLGVPDEENLSAGMRAGVLLLDELKKKYNFDYKLMINSEPHQRKNPEKGVFSYGSIGKLMPFVYVRGYLAHAGKVFEGLNPTNIMCEIVRRTEVNTDFSDVVGPEVAPPPTWLYLRENKLSYDVSMPLTINGCLSVLLLNQTPGELMSRVRTICEESFDAVIEGMNKQYAEFLRKGNREVHPLPWKTKVVDFGELYREAEDNYGEKFKNAYDKKMESIKNDIESGKESLIMSNFKLIDFIYDYIDDLSPRVVIGLMPPYYPNVANIIGYENNNEVIKNLHADLNKFVGETFGQEYEREYFYTGISDLSYSYMEDSKKVSESLKSSMPFFGSLYTLPLEEIEEISMPCVNIGPWGKDFHKLTERVYKEDLYQRTPQIVRFAIEHILGS